MQCKTCSCVSPGFPQKTYKFVQGWHSPQFTFLCWNINMVGYQLVFLRAQTKPPSTAKCASSRYADGRVPDHFFDQLMGLCWSQRTLEHHTNASWSPLVQLCPPAAIWSFPLLEVRTQTRQSPLLLVDITQRGGDMVWRRRGAAGGGCGEGGESGDGGGCWRGRFYGRAKAFTPRWRAERLGAGAGSPAPPSFVLFWSNQIK